MLTIKTFIEGPIGANNYLVIDEESRDAVLIDCSSYRPSFVDAIKESNVNLKCILLTHGHFDHLLGVDEFKRIFGVDAYMSEDDMKQVQAAPEMTLLFLGMPSESIESISHFVKDGDEFQIGNTKIKAISTPGHTKGGICYLIDNNLFSGDTLFQGSVGRCDLLDGDFGAIVKSVNEKLFTLPASIDVYPGHGPKTTIEYEKKFNEIVNM